MFCIKKSGVWGDQIPWNKGAEEPTVSSPSGPQSISLLGPELLPAVAEPPPPCPAAVLQLPSPTPRTAGRGCGRGREPGQLLALPGSGEGCDIKEPTGQGSGGNRPPPTTPPGGLLAGSEHLGHRSCRPRLWGGGEKAVASQHFLEREGTVASKKG